jgi:hypothetical protein
MKEIRYLIQTHPSRQEFVYGHDGEQFEFTTDRRTAWRMTKEQAERRLEKIKRKEKPLSIIKP